MPPALRAVDTSAWIEWLIGSALGEKLGSQFPDKPQCVVPTNVQSVLSKWMVRELGEDQADQVITYTQSDVAAMRHGTVDLRCPFQGAAG